MAEPGRTGPVVAALGVGLVAGATAGAAADPARGWPIWSPAALDAFLASPEDVAPGTLMTFVGLDDPSERADLIAWLRTTAERHELGVRSAR